LTGCGPILDYWMTEYNEAQFHRGVGASPKLDAIPMTKEKMTPPNHVGHQARPAQPETNRQIASAFFLNRQIAHSQSNIRPHHSRFSTPWQDFQAPHCVLLGPTSDELHWHTHG
jgi:hypothetical protein